jgi:tetratricopeptide (TPR) repeat protein
LLAPIANRALATRFARLLNDENPLLRAGAVGLQRGASPEERILRVAALLDDDAATVRFAAVRQLLDAPVTRLPDEVGVEFDEAYGQWLDSLAKRSDFPEAQVALAGIALALRNFAGAADAFGEALQLDPEMVEAWIMRIRIAAALADLGEARRLLDQALAANPGHQGLLALGEELKGIEP